MTSIKDIQIIVGGYVATKPERIFLPVDGTQDALTRRCIGNFQRAHDLAPDGIVGPLTEAKFNTYRDTDGTTEHFTFAEFWSKDGQRFNGGKVGAAEVRRNVQRLMWRLEALRQKLGGKTLWVNSGFRSIAHNTQLDRAATNSMHLYGVAADISVRGVTPAKVAEMAKTCGFSGVKAYASHVHVDTRAEHDPYRKSAPRWWWPLSGLNL